VYTLAYLGDRGLVWELGTCLLLQQYWLGYKINGPSLFHVQHENGKNNGISQGGFARSNI
jgi:hypothetical protein